MTAEQPADTSRAFDNREYNPTLLACSSHGDAQEVEFVDRWDLFREAVDCA